MEEAFTQWLQNNRHWALWLVPAFAFLEAMLGIGIFVSSAFLVIVGTMVYAQGIAPIGVIVALGFIGATIADQMGFFIGRRVGPRFHLLGLVQRNRNKIDKAEELIRRRGSFAIFIGRFIPAIRSMLPALLGISGFPPARYVMLDLAACLLWSLALGAIVMGAQSLL